VKLTSNEIDVELLLLSNSENNNADKGWSTCNLLTRSRVSVSSLVECRSEH